MAQHESTRNSSDESTVTEMSRPTQAERFFFDNNGYLIVEDFLKEDHINALTEALLPRCRSAARTTRERNFPHGTYRHQRRAQRAHPVYLGRRSAFP